jgi:DNA-binding XRE family transcriptional regulator
MKKSSEPSENMKNFLKLVSPEKSNFLAGVKWRHKNRSWIRVSQRIALKVLIRLDELNWTKEMLAKKSKLNITTINKIVKGQYNASLKTLMKLEESLDISIINKHLK